MELAPFVLDMGPAAIGLTLWLSAAGAPIPTTPLLLLAGALAQQGQTGWLTLLALSLLSVILGDLTSFFLARLSSDKLGRWLQQRFGASYDRTQLWLQEHGHWGVFMTRFLVTPLDVPTNLIAGGSGYPLPTFLLWTLAGRTLWLLIYGGLGYAAGVRWPDIAGAIQQQGTWLAVAGPAALGLILLWRHHAGRKRALAAKPAETPIL